MLYRNKERYKAWRIKYRLKNKNRIKETSRLYRIKNKERCLNNAKQWRLKNKQWVKKYNLKYRLKNKKILKEKRKIYILNNKDKIKQYLLNNKERHKNYYLNYSLQNKNKIRKKNQKYYLKNKERIKKYVLNNRYLKRASEAKRRATKLRATPKFANLEKIKEIYKNCPKGYHVDHIIPLQGKKTSELTTKYDGSPAIVYGHHPENSKFFVASKFGMSKPHSVSNCSSQLLAKSSQLHSPNPTLSLIINSFFCSSVSSFACFTGTSFNPASIQAFRRILPPKTILFSSMTIGLSTAHDSL